VAFRHGLMADVLYGDLLPGERSALHRRLAQALSATPGAPAAQLAHHWHRAGALAEALAASVTAGLEAARMLAYAETQGHLERALELWDAVQPAPGTLPLDRAELLARAAEAARFAGDPERGIALGRRALAEIDANADPARAARQFERLGEAHFWDDAAALEWYGKALALLPERPSPERARLLAAEGHALMGLRRWAEARERCEAALAAAEAVRAPDAATGALATLGLVLGFLGAPDEGEVHLRRALEHARAARAGDDTARAYINLGELLRLRGDHAGALQAMTEGASLAGSAGLDGSFGRFMYVNGADDLLRLGRWDEVEARLAEAGRMELGLTTEAMHRAIAAQLHALRGATALAREDRDRALAIVDALPPEFVTPARTAAALLALVEGEPAAAREHVQAALAAAGEKDPLYTPPLLVAGVRAEAELAGNARARRHAADADDAVRRAAALVAELDGIAGTPPDAVAHRALAEAELARARGEPAADRWADAARRFDALHEPHPAAYARLRQTEDVLAAGGERPEAARLLAAVQQTAAALGATPLEAAATTLARMARLELRVPAPAAPSGGDDDAPCGLTARELEVLLLLAEGLTNREIATRLYVTAKTVGTHVAHIFEKLDVHTRVQAAARAQQLGLPVRAP
jgi:DNA-binding CsgD family transcriptional regulator/tetratricopeptide (TPR) repeat protein